MTRVVGFVWNSVGCAEERMTHYSCPELGEVGGLLYSHVSGPQLEVISLPQGCLAVSGDILTVGTPGV